MSAKMRLTLWFLLMVLILAVLTIGFILVLNGTAVTDDPAGRLVKVIVYNADHLEFEHGHFDWNNIYMYRRGVYCTVYDERGNMLVGASIDDIHVELPFEANEIRTVEIGGQSYYIYDTFVDMSVSDVWMRGIISTDDRSGLMHTILVLTFTLLPALLVITALGGWLIAAKAFRPMEKILAAADSISDGRDLSARIGLIEGPEEMVRLSRSFDRMFGRLESSFVCEQQFTTDASHELRTPITVILAECDRAKRKCESREDFLMSVGVIEEQGQRMSELVQSLLSLTRLQHGTDKYPLCSADLSEFTDACCCEASAVRQNGISLEADIESGVIARFNPSLMARLLHNLLQNAYKYGKEGGHIRLSLRKEGKTAVLRVEDDGIGIAEENIDKIWLRFWQGEQRGDDDSGTGLGLAMVKEIAEFHNGSAEVESKLGKGSVFTVTIPI